MRSAKTIIILVSIIVVGLMLWAVMLKLTWEDQTPNRLLVEMGKTGATLSLITVIGGLVQWILKDVDVRRQREKEKLNFYRNVLSDFKSVYDKVEKARLLIEAHRTAKTYGEQMRELIDGVVILHNIKRALNPEFPKLKEELKPYIRGMNLFIKGLLNEYRDNYKRISVLQEIDEKRKTILKEERAKHSKLDITSNDIPSGAWEQMKILPKLGALRDDRKFREYDSHFLKYLDKASAILRERIPVEEEN